MSGHQKLKAVDLSKHMITHMNIELTSGIADVEKLNLDQNSISKLENLSHLKKLQQLSAGHNCLIKISGLETLSRLTVLNLPENSICAIEGLKNLTQLVWLNLSGNNIRSISGLEDSLALKHLDLSDNTITHLSNLSHIYTLKTLLLHGNIIRSLAEASKLLPKNLNILSLAENEITELHQVRSLSQLKKLEQLSLMNNPCVSYQQFIHYSTPYRAYVLSWACNLEVLDGQHVTVNERQNASQLLSEGAAHRFGSGEQNKLVSYLSSVQFNSLVHEKSLDNFSSPGNKEERPATSGGREKTTTQSSPVRRTRSEERLHKADITQNVRNTPSAPQYDDQPSYSPIKYANKHRQTSTTDSPTASPLVTRRDMQGLIRQVIGQERSPGGSTAMTTPKQSAALPKMSRSRSASRSPSRRDHVTPASRRLNLAASSEAIDRGSGVFTSEPGDVPFTNAAYQQDTQVALVKPQTPTRAFTEVQRKAALKIQTMWRGYRTRNLNPEVTRIKQEIRCQRLEDTVTFLLAEVNRQHEINREGQNIRSYLISSIEQLYHKLEELSSPGYSEPSAV